MIKSIGGLGQDLNEDIFFPERPVCLPGLTMVSKAVGLSQELGCTYHRNGIYVIFFLQYIFYKADGVLGCVQYLFYLGNGLAFCRKYKTSTNKKKNKFFHTKYFEGKDNETKFQKVVSATAFGFLPLEFFSSLLLHSRVPQL